MSAVDRRAIQQCRGLHRSMNAIEDLRPIDAATSLTLEYSYRPLNNISKFWAGPSYWKFRQPLRRRLKTSAVAATAGVKTSAAKQYEPLDLTAPFDSSIFISVHSDQAKKIRQCDVSKWDEKKLKLPTDYHVDRTRFDRYVFAPGIPYKCWLKRPPTDNVVAANPSNLLDNDGGKINNDDDVSSFFLIIVNV